MPTKAGTFTGDDFTDTLSDTAQNVKDTVTDTAARAKQKVSDAGRQASDKIDEKRGPAADALQSAASTIHEKAEDLPGGETVKSVAHLQPTWVPAFDLFPLESIETRTMWLGRAVEGNWLVGFGHDCDVDFARIAADAKAKFVIAR